MADQATRTMPSPGTLRAEQPHDGRLPKPGVPAQANRGAGRRTRKGLLAAAAVPLILGAAFLLSGGGDDKISFFGDLTGVMGERPQRPAAAAAVFYDVPELLVNLSSSGNSYLKLSLALELGAGDRSRELDRYLPRLVDSFQAYLRDLRVEDLQGSAGLQRLREDLLSRANTVVPQADVQDVLFKQLLVQ
jgi:flagellar FliL protein